MAYLRLLEGRRGSELVVRTPGAVGKGCLSTAAARLPVRTSDWYSTGGAMPREPTSPSASPRHLGPVADRPIRQAHSVHLQPVMMRVPGPWSAEPEHDEGVSTAL
jgi:hypothetical protein